MNQGRGGRRAFPGRSRSGQVRWRYRCGFSVAKNRRPFQGVESLTTYMFDGEQFEEEALATEGKKSPQAGGAESGVDGLGIVQRAVLNRGR